MKVERSIEKFYMALEEHSHKGDSFPVLCGLAGVSSRRLDRALRRIFGMTGAEIVEAYRTNMPISML